MQIWKEWRIRFLKACSCIFKNMIFNIAKLPKQNGVSESGCMVHPYLHISLINIPSLAPAAGGGASSSAATAKEQHHRRPPHPHHQLQQRHQQGPKKNRLIECILIQKCIHCLQPKLTKLQLGDPSFLNKETVVEAEWKGQAELKDDK